MKKRYEPTAPIINLQLWLPPSPPPPFTSHTPHTPPKQTNKHTHHHHQSTFSTRSVFPSQPFVCGLQRVAMMMAERVGAAKRRRERRLRSWAKHERMTVAMALAENLHHSRQKVEGSEHDGPRAQKTARVTGARPGVLTEPELQGGGSHGRIRGCPGAVAGRASLRHLTAAALRQREEEERQKRLKEREEAKKRADEMQSLLAVPRALRTPAQLRRFQELAAQSSDTWASLRRSAATLVVDNVSDTLVIHATPRHPTPPHPSPPPSLSSSPPPLFLPSTSPHPPPPPAVPAPCVNFSVWPLLERWRFP